MPIDPLERLLELQAQQLEIMKSQKATTDIKLDTIEATLRSGSSETSSRLGAVEKRLTRVESNLDIANGGWNQAAISSAALETRIVEQGKRLSDISHRAVKLEDTAAGIRAEIEHVQQRCAAHGQQLSTLGVSCDELKDKLDEHMSGEIESMKEQVREVSQRFQIVDDRVHVVGSKVQQVDTSAVEFKAQVTQTWKVILIVCSALVGTTGLMFGIAKLAGCIVR